MKHRKIYIPKFTLIGLTVRTNNKNEMNPEVAKIGSLANYYWSNNVAKKIKHRLNPGVTYSVYTDFESDEHGEYTYFIGEAVDSIDGQDLSQFKVLTVSQSNYQKFTTDSGKMPDIVINAWHKIWSMKKDDFNGERTYITDFEIYDQRASDPNNAVVDIYIGIK